MQVLLVLFIGVLIFAAIFLAALALFPSRKAEKYLRQLEAKKESTSFDWKNLTGHVEQIFKPLGAIIPRSPQEMSRQERRLWQAGFRRKDGPILLYGIKVGSVILLFAFCMLSGVLQNNFLLGLILPVFLGAFLPDFLLSRLIARRKERLELALPDTLDLTVICVEVGLSLDQALMRISEEISNSHPDLADELSIFNLEVRAGQSRARALRNLADRTEVDDLRSLVTVLIQSDRFGTSIGNSLRIFSDTFRTRQRQRAEEQAAKMSIKMIPALILFILPALIVVVMGPAIIIAIRELLPGLTME